jgi:pyruvate,water dikinase
MTAKHQEGFPAQGEIEGYWDWDKIHAPRPLTPLAGDAIVMAMAEGFTIAQHAFGSPLALRCRMVNNYLYATFCPDENFPAQSDQDIERYVEELDRIAARTGDRWVNEWEPSLLPPLHHTRTFDFLALSDEELAQELETQLQNVVDQWTIHGWINLSLVPATALMEFYNAEMQPEDPNEAWQLMQGYPTKSVETSEGLWRFSRQVKDSPALSQIFQTLEPAQMIEALEATDEGRQFLADLRAFLDDFGWRSDGIYEVADLTWREDLTIPLNTIQGYLALDGDHNPEHTLARATARREELAAAVRAKLANDPAKLARFEELMDAAKHNLRVTEDHSFWIDQMGTAAFRRFCLDVGQRLVDKGVIANVDDVFYLYKDELKDELRSALRDATPMHETVAQRRAEKDRWAQVVPPPHLGDPTPNNSDPFFVAIVDKMLGLLPIEPSTDPNVISGVAASPGVVRGTAKVVRSLTEASKLQAGDIMVCEMTVPTWVPLFATVAAVVADSGGILSHCAIVAREFHLPAVVGTMVGTEVLKDGMTVTVDGSKGIVRIEERT